MKLYLLWIDLVVTTILAVTIALRCKRLCHHSLIARIGYQVAILGLAALALRTVIRLIYQSYGDVSEGHIFALLSRTGLMIAFLAASPHQEDSCDKKEAGTKEEGCVHDDTTPQDGTVIPGFKAITIPEFSS